MPYEPTAREMAALEAHRARRRSAPPFRGMTFDKRTGFSSDHVDEVTGCQLLAAASGLMAATHELTLVMAKRLARAENIPQQDSAERALNKLGRTFAAQVEALRRHRHGGQQKVTVEHVTVNDGGQAFVGTVEAGGHGRKTGR